MLYQLAQLAQRILLKNCDATVVVGETGVYSCDAFTFTVYYTVAAMGRLSSIDLVLDCMGIIHPIYNIHMGNGTEGFFLPLIMRA